MISCKGLTTSEGWEELARTAFRRLNKPELLFYVMPSGPCFVTELTERNKMRFCCPVGSKAKHSTLKFANEEIKAILFAGYQARRTGSYHLKPKLSDGF